MRMRAGLLKPANLELVTPPARVGSEMTID
ncbi:UNVERIFIED_ORG: hypothetical protein GGE53_001379 [Rhizobium etli]